MQGHGVSLRFSEGISSGSAHAWRGKDARSGMCCRWSHGSALGDVERGEAHIDKQAHVAVAKVVNAYPRGGRCLATAVHLVREVLYCRVLRCTTQ